MPKYIIKVDAEHEIDAIDEEQAIQKFWDTIINDTQMDAGTYINDNLTVINTSDTNTKS